MFPPIFSIAAANAAVKAALGDDPVRLFAFDEAPQETEKPYAVWQVYAGSPENYLGDTPDMDRTVLQVDVYGEKSNPGSVLTAARALRDALEPHAHITAWRGTTTDKDTGNKRLSFDVEFFTAR